MLAFHSNYVSILHHFSDVAYVVRYWSKIADFNLPKPVFGVHFRVDPFEFCQVLWRQKSRFPGLSCRSSCGKK